MRFKMAHKLFLLNTGVIVALTAVFICLSYFSSRSMYSNALNGIDDEVLESLSDVLSTHYRKNASWDAFINDQMHWEQTVDSTFFAVFFHLMAKVAEERGEPYTPPPPTQETPKWEFPFGTFRQRLSLLDQQKSPLIQPEIFNQDATYVPITSERRIVGWLRVGRINVDMLPLAQYFFNQQLQIVYWAAIAGGLIAMLLSFLLSRHITAPMKDLTLMARQIAKRNFGGLVRVGTRDELQEVAEGFNYAARQLAQYQQQQKQWLMDVSHELKTPLTVLVGEVFAICDDLTKCNEATAELLQKEAMRIKRIADDLYQLCQIDERGIQLDRRPVRLAEVARLQIQGYSAKFRAREITVEEKYLAEPRYVFADSDRLAQVLRNLLENCLRYMDAPGAIWVVEEISLGKVNLVVEDSGPGVSPESMSKIFDRFYRNERQASNSSDGSGLGLTISKEIVLAHGGIITAGTSAKGGLRITITLPQH